MPAFSLVDLGGASPVPAAAAGCGGGCEWAAAAEFGAPGFAATPQHQQVFAFAPHVMHSTGGVPGFARSEDGSLTAAAAAGHAWLRQQQHFDHNLLLAPPAVRYSSSGAVSSGAYSAGGSDHAGDAAAAAAGPGAAPRAGSARRLSAPGLTSSWWGPSGGGFAGFIGCSSGPQTPFPLPAGAPQHNTGGSTVAQLQQQPFAYHSSSSGGGGSADDPGGGFRGYDGSTAAAAAQRAVHQAEFMRKIREIATDSSRGYKYRASDSGHSGRSFLARSATASLPGALSGSAPGGGGSSALSAAAPAGARPPASGGGGGGGGGLGAAAAEGGAP